MITRPSAPADISPAALRSLAALADRIDRLEAAAEALAGADPTGDGLDDLRALVLVRLEDEDAILAIALAEWLAADPEHAHILRLATVLPWQDPRTGWLRRAPRWARILATHAELVQPGLTTPAHPD